MVCISCQNQLCVYWDKNKCILDSISLNTIGICRDSIHIDIDEKEIKNKIKETLYTLQNNL